MSKSVVEAHGTSCIVDIDVVPGAPKTEIGRVNEWRGSLQVKLAAKPVEGEANEELIRFISEEIGVPRNSVKILRGGTSRHKIVEIDAPKEVVEKSLGVTSC